MTAAITLAGPNEDDPVKNPLSASAISRLRRHIGGVLVTIGLAAGMVAATPTPADAASLVIGCFIPNAAGYSLHEMPVNIYAYHNNVAYYLTTVKMSNHCATWNVPAHLRGYHLGMTLDFRVNSPTYQLRWFGESQYWAVPGEDVAFLGINVAYCRTGCFMY
jgi:hypothetical protein